MKKNSIFLYNDLDFSKVVDCLTEREKHIQYKLHRSSFLWKLLSWSCDDSISSTIPTNAESASLKQIFIVAVTCS